MCRYGKCLHIQHIEVGTKLLPFRRQWFQTHFLEWECYKFDWNFINVCPKGPINNTPASLQMIPWRQLGNRPLTEPMVVRLPKHVWLTRPQWIKTEAHGTMSNKNLNGDRTVYIKALNSEPHNHKWWVITTRLCIPSKMVRLMSFHLDFHHMTLLQILSHNE